MHFKDHQPALVVKTYHVFCAKVIQEDLRLSNQTQNTLKVISDWLLCSKCWRKTINGGLSPYSHTNWITLWCHYSNAVATFESCACVIFLVGRAFLKYRNAARSNCSAGQPVTTSCKHGCHLLTKTQWAVFSMQGQQSSLFINKYVYCSDADTGGLHASDT